MSLRDKFKKYFSQTSDQDASTKELQTSPESADVEETPQISPEVQEAIDLVKQVNLNLIEFDIFKNKLAHLAQGLGFIPRSNTKIYNKIGDTYGPQARHFAKLAFENEDSKFNEFYTVAISDLFEKSLASEKSYIGFSQNSSTYEHKGAFTVKTIGRSGMEIDIGPKKINIYDLDNLGCLDDYMSNLDSKYVKALSTVLTSTLKGLVPVTDFIDSARNYHNNAVQERNRIAQETQKTEKIRAENEFSEIVQSIEEELNSSPSHGPS